jgi:hypothetical protein
VRTNQSAEPETDSSHEYSGEKEVEEGEEVEEVERSLSQKMSSDKPRLKAAC